MERLRVLPPGSEAIATRRIAFLSRFADFASEHQLRQLQTPEGPLAAADALTEAASLAFAIGLVEQGRDLANRAWEAVWVFSSQDPPLLRAVLIGSVLGRLKVELTRGGVTLGSPMQIIFWSDAPAHVEPAGALLAAALANPDQDVSVLPDLGASSPTEPAIHAMAAAAEANTQWAFTQPPRAFAQPSDAEANEEARIAFGALHQRYAARLRLLAPMHPGWEARRMHAELIDWPLLALHVGLRRRGVDAKQYILLGNGPGAIAGGYIDDLASELVGVTPPDWWRDTQRRFRPRREA